MEIYTSDSHLTIKRCRLPSVQNSEESTNVLLCSRYHGRFSVASGSGADESTYLGGALSLLGVLPPLPDAPGKSHLLVVTRRAPVCTHPMDNTTSIYRVEEVAALPLSMDAAATGNDLLSYSATVSAARRVASGTKSTTKPSAAKPGTRLVDELNKSGRAMFKTATQPFRMVADTVANLDDMSSGTEKRGRSASPSQRGISPLLDGVLKLFNDSGHFYYCDGADITNTVQRGTSKEPPDERFIYNKHMLPSKDIEQYGEIMSWMSPVIQGFIQHTELQFVLEEELTVPVHVTLISRRSTYRAGTRYIKRGINRHGNVANFVESEQIVSVVGHVLSFVTVRGSVPAYWSQRGYRYRPPPVLDRPAADAQPAFDLHMNYMLQRYGGRVVAVSLTDQAGRELPLGQAYIDLVLGLDDERVSFCAFDFHDQCRGLRMDRIACLVAALGDDLRAMQFTWCDSRGVQVCRQAGVIRVNCVDCLDRTNVVQNALAQAALEYQLYKLGLLCPLDENANSLPRHLVDAINRMWADNGDVMSLQYAGTAALKGDVTRSGQRNVKGLMRDGYSSVSRYYLCHVRDAARQNAVDALLGKRISDEAGTGAAVDDDESEEAAREQVAQLVLDCQRFFLPRDEIGSASSLLGSWCQSQSL